MKSNAKKANIEKLIDQNFSGDEERAYFCTFFEKSKLTKKDIHHLTDYLQEGYSPVSLFKRGNTFKFDGVDTHFVGKTRHFFDELMAHIKAKGMLSEIKDICAELDASCSDVDIESDNNVLLYPGDVRKYKAWHAKNKKKLKLSGDVKPYDDGYGKMLSVPRRNWEKYLDSTHQDWLKKHAA